MRYAVSSPVSNSYREGLALLNTNIDQTLPYNLHGLIHYKIGVTLVYNGHVFYTLL